MNKLGWIGSLLLAFCGAPEAYRALTTDQYEISLPFILMWGLGELCLLIPVIKQIKKPYLVFNYGANLVFIAVILTRLLFDYLTNQQLTP